MLIPPGKIRYLVGTGYAAEISLPGKILVGYLVISFSSNVCRDIKMQKSE